jgi:hypothetical protein
MVLEMSIFVLFCAIAKFAFIRMESATSQYVRACELDAPESPEVAYQPRVSREQSARRAPSLVPLRER